MTEAKNKLITISYDDKPGHALFTIPSAFGDYTLTIPYGYDGAALAVAYILLLSDDPTTTPLYQDEFNADDEIGQEFLTEFRDAVGELCGF